MRKVVVFSLLFFSILISFSKEEKQRVVSRELKNDFFTIRKDNKTAMPLLSSQTTKKAYLILNIDNRENQYLTFQSYSDLTVYLNNQLVFKGEENIEEHLSFKELHKRGHGEVVLAFHSPTSSLNPKEFFITKIIPVEQKEGYLWHSRLVSNRSVTTVFLILIISMVAYIKNTNSTLWAGYFDIRRVFFEKLNKEEYVPKSFFSLESIVLIILVSLLGGVLFHEYELNVLLEDISAMLKPIYYFFIVLIFLVAKHFLLRIVTWFLNISSFGNQQFYDFMRFSLWFTMCLLVLTFSFGDEYAFVTKGFFWIGLVFWNIKIFIGALTRLKFQKMYLFSYICASELLPALALVNFIDTIH